MNRIEEACADILSGYKGYENSIQGTEKVASAKPVKLNNKYQSILSSINLKKVANEIREAVKPVEVSYNDMGQFLKEIGR